MLAHSSQPPAAQQRVVHLRAHSLLLVHQLRVLLVDLCRHGDWAHMQTSRVSCGGGPRASACMRCAAGTACPCIMPPTHAPGAEMEIGVDDVTTRTGGGVTGAGAGAEGLVVGRTLWAASCWGGAVGLPLLPASTMTVGGCCCPWRVLRGKGGVDFSAVCGD
jgi:hypothetical protein